LGVILHTKPTHKQLPLFRASNLGVGLHTKSTLEQSSLLGVSNSGDGLHTKSTLKQLITLFRASNLGVSLHTKSTIKQLPLFRASNLGVGLDIESTPKQSHLQCITTPQGARTRVIALSTDYPDVLDNLSLNSHLQSVRAQVVFTNVEVSRITYL